MLFNPNQQIFISLIKILLIKRDDDNDEKPRLPSEMVKNLWLDLVWPQEPVGVTVRKQKWALSHNLLYLPPTPHAPRGTSTFLP